MAAQSAFCEEFATGDVAAASARLGTPARSAKTPCSRAGVFPSSGKPHTKHAGAERNIRADKAVIIGTGGSSGNVNFRRMFDPRLTGEYCGLAGMPWSDQDASGEIAGMEMPQAGVKVRRRPFACIAFGISAGHGGGVI